MVVDDVVGSGVAKNDANLCVAAEADEETAGIPVEPKADVGGAELVGVKNDGGLESDDTDEGVGPGGVANEKGVELLDIAPNPEKPVNRSAGLGYK